MKRKSAVAVFLALTLFFTLSSYAFAYSLKGYKIDKCITYRPENTIGQTSLTHMAEATSKWNAVVPKTILALGSSTTDLGKYPRYDGINGVYKRNTGSTKYVGQNTHWSLDGILLESDIVFNIRYPFANQPESGSQFFDTYTVYLHELGHSVGLADLKDDSDSDKVMYKIIFPGGTKRNLTQDDIDGARKIYYSLVLTEEQ